MCKSFLAQFKNISRLDSQSKFQLFTLFMYRSIPKPPIPPPRQTPGGFYFFEKFWSNSPLCCQFRRSNAPPVRASKMVKSPTLQGKQNVRIAYLWKLTESLTIGNRFCKIFQPPRISCSACLRSTL